MCGPAKWIMIGVVAAVDFAWARQIGATVVFDPTFIIIALTIWFIYSRPRPDQRIASLALSVAELYSISAAVALLTYLSVLSGMHPMDSQLAAIDRALGLDWPGVFTWVMERPGLKRVLSFCYWSLLTQVFVLLIFLNITYRLDRIVEFMSLYITTLIACALISLAFPADSAWAHHGITGDIAYHMPHLMALRDGTMRTLDVAQMHGIITFPSFHAALGILFIYATRRTVLFIPAVVINVGMIMATPTIGGHHFIDVPAGLAIALIGCMLYSSADKAVRGWRQSLVLTG
jgi:hypothetical protein